MRDYTIDQWVLTFFAYSFVGYVWEVFYESILQKKLVNRGFLTGPVLPIYGFGAIIVLNVVMPCSDSLWNVAVFGGLAATLLELVTGWAMEKIFEVRYWDYSNYWGNFKGYISPLSSAAWCGFSVLLSKFIHPFVHRAIALCPKEWADVLAIFLSTLFAADVTVSVVQSLDLRGFLREMFAESERLSRIAGAAGRIRDNVSAGIAYAGEKVNGIPGSIEDVARSLVARMKALKPLSYKVARRILKNNPSATARKFKAFIDRIRDQQ